MSIISTPFAITGLGINVPQLEVKINPYCSISDVEEWIRGVDLNLFPNTPEKYEEVVGKAIRRAERFIDNKTHTSFHRVKRREFHSGSLEAEIILDCYPVLELTLVEVHSASLQTGMSYPPEMMVLDNEAGTVSFPSWIYGGTPNSWINPSSAVAPMATFTFLPGNKNVKFEYWYGWDTPPDGGYHAGIRDACAMVAGAFLMEEAEQSVNNGMFSIGVDGQSSGYGAWTQRAEKLLARAAEMYSRYTRNTFGGVAI